MLGVFTAQKAMQAAAVALKSVDPHRMSRLRLLKLLYIAGREHLGETGRTITGDRAFALDHGPVLSRVYDCIKGTDAAATEWETFIRRSGPQDVEFARDPGIGALSQAEVRRLQEVATATRPTTTGSLRN